RKRLLLSGLPRFVVRKTSKNIIVQIVEARLEGDHILVSAHSREVVRDFGWLGHCDNSSIAYLTGLLAGLKAVKIGVKEAVLDAGVFKPTKGGRIAAALKGVLDAGLNIPHGEEMLPSDDRVSGRHIAEYASKLKSENPELYKKAFSNYLKKGLDAESIVEHFNEVKNRILKVYGRV
ncbi:50S ribosomal protein L18, partial [Candidatus Bathyarchaeota archaeon]|nr:50S ribosomal protein L18 [Candidatus Bathyarchaeota archaeon]